jgi:hypothetical protein
MSMHNAIRRTTALFAVLGAIGIAHAEGGPGDSGVSGPDGSASSVTAAGQGTTQPKKATHAHKRAHRSSTSASGAKADGPMSNGTVGKGG